MFWLKVELAKLKDDLPPAVSRFIGAIADLASQSEISGNLIEISKDQVLAKIKDIESNEPSSDTIRKRLQLFREALQDAQSVLVEGTPYFSIYSRKNVFVIEVNEAAEQKLKSATTREALSKSGRNDLKSNLGNMLPVQSEFEIPTHYVFVSHNWEDEERNKILDAFAEDLTRSCSKLPARWAREFKIDIKYDRRGAFHGRADFSSQAMELCEQSAFALFLVSSGWCQSKPCQEEAEQFRARGTDPNSFLVIQFTGKRDDLTDEFRTPPNYPQFKKEWIKLPNLIHLWQENLPVREAFVDHIRDEICSFLEGYDGPHRPKPRNMPEKAKQQEHLTLRKLTPKINSEIDSAHLIETQFSQSGGDDLTEVEERGLPAVETLVEWACDPKADNRLIVLLGGFGMGKTTTVQFFHEKLLEMAEAGEPTPAPIYLDFRRLIPKSETGRPITASLAELIHLALHPDAQRKATGEDVIRLIRTEKCVVIFDGLDEVGNRIGREYATQLYRQFLELISADILADEAEGEKPDWEKCGTRLVLTCRTHFFRSVREQNALFLGNHRRRSRVTISDDLFSQQLMNSGIQVYHMAPLRLEQIDELFRKYLGEEMGSNTMRLIDRVHDLPGLASRPIMARFISEVAGALIEQHNAGKPINIATIYEELFLRGLERDAEKRPLLKEQDRRDILKALAVHLHLNKLGPQSANDLERWFDGFAQSHNGVKMILGSGGVNARDLLHTELENASFLVRDGDDRFRFAHTSYYEYFLAQAFADAGTSGEFCNLTQGEVSKETSDFLWAIAEREGRTEELSIFWTGILRSNAPLMARKFTFDMLQYAIDRSIPRGSNLSGFDFRGKGFRAKTGVLDTINLSKTKLNRCDFRDVEFRNCNFEKATLSNATFENCKWQDPEGKPVGLLSARGVETSLPSSWCSGEIIQENRWRDLENYARQRLLRGSFGNSVGFSPDGKRLVSGGNDGSVRLWDAEEGSEILVLKGHEDWVRSVGFSPDGKRLVSGGDDGTVRLWDAEDGSEILVLKGHEREVQSVGFSPDGKRLVSGGSDGTVRLWDVEDGSEILVIKGHEILVRSVGFSPDGKRLVSGGDDGTLRLWDAEDGSEILVLKGHEDWVRSVGFSPDGKRLVSGGDDGTVRLWDAEDGYEILVLKGHERGVLSVGFSPDGKRLVSGGYDGTVRLWDAQDGSEILFINGHQRGMQSVGFSPDGKRLVSGGDDGTVRLWDAEDGSEILVIKGHEDLVRNVGFSPDGKRLVSGGYDGTVRLWDAEDGSEILAIKGAGNLVQSVGFSPDGKRLVSGGYDGTVRLWDAEDGSEILVLKGHENLVQSVGFSPDGKRLVSGGDDGSVRLWDAEDGSEILVIKGHEDWVRSVGFSPDGKRLVSGGSDGTVHLWDAEEGSEILVIKGHEDWVQSVGFSPDGKRLVSGGDDGTVRLWDVEDGSEILVIKGHEDWVRSVGFSPDGKRLVSGGSDGTVHLWDAEEGSEILVIKGHEDWVQSVGFSPDGKRLVSGGSDGTVRLWEACIGEMIYTSVGLPESWVVLDAEDRIKRNGPNFWRYVA